MSLSCDAIYADDSQAMSKYVQLPSLVRHASKSVASSIAFCQSTTTNMLQFSLITAVGRLVIYQPGLISLLYVLAVSKVGTLWGSGKY